MSDKNTFTLDPQFMRGFHRTVDSEEDLKEFDPENFEVSEADLLVSKFSW
jgi:hypothetical protein